MAKDKNGKKAKAKVEETKAKKAKGGKGSKGGGLADDFADPSSGDQFVNKDHVGSVVLISPFEFEAGFKTSAGEADIVRGDVVVLTSKKGKELDEPLVYENTIIFGKVLVSTLKAQVGKSRVLGVLEEGEAKKGQSAPYVLRAASDDQKKMARAYLKKTDPFA